MRELHMTEGFDVGLEMSGAPTAIQGMLEHMIHGGRVALLGIPPADTVIDWNQVIFKGLQIKGIYGREMFETWYKMAAMLQSGLNLSPIITHHFSVEQYEEAFAIMSSGCSGKVILDWRNRSTSRTTADTRHPVPRFRKFRANAHQSVTPT